MNKFKAGDWVVHNGQFKKVKSCEGYAVIFDDLRESYCHQDGCILWQPQEGEWCWFLNNNREPILKQFLQMCPIVPTNYISKQGLISGSVEPFIGKLPTFLKENT